MIFHPQAQTCLPQPGSVAEGLKPRTSVDPSAMLGRYLVSLYYVPVGNKI